MMTLKKYSSFNSRRYGDPWVGICKDGKIDFSQHVGGYTGRRGRGEEGELYIEKPLDGVYYAYGQKDYRGGKTELEFVRYINGEFVKASKAEMIKNTLQ